jgi:F-type H+-transporting ATPase subunit epsilon
MSLHLEVVTPEKKVFSDTVENVYLPGEDGELGILEQHAALVTNLKPGELRYQKGRETIHLAVGSGFAEVTEHKVVVLTDNALGESEIDEAKAEAAIQRAEDALKSLDHSGDAEEVAHLQAIIAKSMAQLRLKRRNHS